MKKIFFFSFIALITISSKSQVPFDTARFVLLTKLNISRLNNINSDASDIDRITRSEVYYRILKSTGFGPIIFFEFDTKKGYNGNEIDISKLLFEIYDSSFIIGINTINGDLYRLKGFEINDFSFLFKQLNTFHDATYFEDSYLKSKKKFLDFFSVAGLDLGCLYDSQRIKKEKSNCNEPNKLMFEGVVQ